MRTIELSYSVDGGASFSDPVSFDALEVWCDLVGEEETEGSGGRRMGIEAVKCQKMTARHRVDIKLSMSNFDPERDTDAELKALIVQVWQCAPVRRLYFAGGSDHFFGAWDLFDDPDNDNYLNVLNYSPEYRRGWASEAGRSNKKLVAVTLECEAKRGYTLTTWDGASWI